MTTATSTEAGTGFAAAMRDLDMVMQYDYLPTPTKTEWSVAEGLVVHVDQADLDKWFGSAVHTDPPQGTVEVLVDHTVYQSTARVLNSPARTPISVRSTLQVTTRQIAIQLHAAGLSFEEIVVWDAEWPTLTDEQKRVEHAEMTGRFQVPPTLLPQPPCVECGQPFRGGSCGHCAECGARCFDCVSDLPTSSLAGRR